MGKKSTRWNKKELQGSHANLALHPIPSATPTKSHSVPIIKYIRWPIPLEIFIRSPNKMTFTGNLLQIQPVLMRGKKPMSFMADHSTSVHFNTLFQIPVLLQLIPWMACTNMAAPASLESNALWQLWQTVWKRFTCFKIKLEYQLN